MENSIGIEEKNQIDLTTLLCNQYHIDNYSINSDGSIDVDGNVDFINENFKQLPLKFGIVSGSFYCGSGKLTTLEGAPTTVGGNFSCSYNELSSLLDGPVTVVGNFSGSYNRLTSLEGGPQTVGGDFHCNGNILSTLKGAPVTVGGFFGCDYNELTTLEGGPKKIADNFTCSYNSLSTLKGAPDFVGGDFYCCENVLMSTYSGDTDIEIIGNFYSGFSDDSKLHFFWDSTNNMYHIKGVVKMILKYQRHFEIWNDDLSLNNENLQILLDEIKDGLL